MSSNIPLFRYGIKLNQDRDLSSWIRSNLLLFSTMELNVTKEWGLSCHLSSNSLLFTQNSIYPTHTHTHTHTHTQSSFEKPLWFAILPLFENCLGYLQVSGVYYRP